MQTIHDSLLGKTTRSRFKWTCGRQISASSKPVLLILTWNFLVSFAIALFTSPDFYSLITSYSSTNLIKVTTLGLSGFLLLFCPLATYLADRKWGRYKTTVYSLYCLLCTATVMCVLGGALIAILVNGAGSQALYISLGVPALTAFLLSLFSLITFKANVLQLGVDQLIDYSSDHHITYVCWYIWTSYAGTAFQQIALSLALNVTASELTILFILIPASTIIILGVTLSIQCCKNHWFINNVIDANPCKLIYQVTNFAVRHKRPVTLQRRAFTYGEDTIPTRFDLAKSRYDGPFTTEQVEDVKTFLRILRVLLALGPIFAVDIAAGSQLPTMAYHLACGSATALLRPVKEAYSILVMYAKTLALNGSVTPLIITFIIPLYILLRQFIKNRVPRTLMQIGLGIIVLLLSLTTTLLLDTVGHIHSSSTACFLNNGPYFNHTCDLVESLSISPLYIIIPYTLNGFAYLLLYIGVYQFILAQSPYGMKGLVVGIFFAIKGFFQLLAVLTVYLPFISWSSDSSFPSCGFIYYLINFVIALTGTLAYSCVSRSYQYRETDEPDNIYLYAEKYYCQYDEDLVYKEKDVDNLVCTEGKKDNRPSTSQTTDTHTQENTTGSKQRHKLKLELPDHISSRNKSEK